MIMSFLDDKLTEYLNWAAMQKGEMQEIELR